MMGINGVLVAGQDGGPAPRGASRVTRRAVFFMSLDGQNTLELLGEPGLSGVMAARRVSLYVSNNYRLLS